jgi:hypothetical protein
MVYGLGLRVWGSLDGVYLSSGQRDREAAQSWQRTT